MSDRVAKKQRPPISRPVALHEPTLDIYIVAVDGPELSLFSEVAILDAGGRPFDGLGRMKLHQFLRFVTLGNRWDEIPLDQLPEAVRAAPAPGGADARVAGGRSGPSSP